MHWIDEHRFLQSTGKAGRRIYPAQIYVDTPTSDVIWGRFSKRLVRLITLTPGGMIFHDTSASRQGPVRTVGAYFSDNDRRSVHYPLT